MLTMMGVLLKIGRGESIDSEASSDGRIWSVLLSQMQTSNSAGIRIMFVKGK